MDDSAQPIKELLAGLYDRAASKYGQMGVPFFATFGRRLAELAQMGPGAKVLDVGVGRGAVLFPSAERAGEHGLVLGIDIAERMVQETAAEIEARDLPSAHVMQMDGERLAFSANVFDHVVCAFAIFFFPELDFALTEFLRVLRPGGSLGISMTRRGDERWQWYDDLLLRYDQEHHFLRNLSTSINQQPDRLHEAMRKAGFTNPQAIFEESEFFHANEEAWWSSLWTHGARRPLEAMEPPVLARFKQEAMTRAQVMKGRHGIPERFAMVYLFGIKPDNEMPV